MLVISQNSNPHATSAVFIEGWTICKPANHATNEKKLSFMKLHEKCFLLSPIYGYVRYVRFLCWNICRIMQSCSTCTDQG